MKKNQSDFAQFDKNVIGKNQLGNISGGGATGTPTTPTTPPTGTTTTSTTPPGDGTRDNTLIPPFVPTPK